MAVVLRRRYVLPYLHHASESFCRGLPLPPFPPLPDADTSLSFLHSRSAALPLCTSFFWLRFISPPQSTFVNSHLHATPFGAHTRTHARTRSSFIPPPPTTPRCQISSLSHAYQPLSPPFPLSFPARPLPLLRYPSPTSFLHQHHVRCYNVLQVW